MNTEKLNGIPAVYWTMAVLTVGGMLGGGIYFLVLGLRTFRTGRFVGRGRVVETGSRARAAGVMCFIFAALGFAGAVLAVVGGMLYH